MAASVGPNSEATGISPNPREGACIAQTGNVGATRFLSGMVPPPRPQNAVAALLVHSDGRYIMQLRDDKPGIFYPGHWGCFGGAVDSGETPIDALRRELREEIGYETAEAAQFTRFDFDFSPLGYPKVYRIYFELRIADASFRDFVLREGADMQALRGEDLLLTRRVTPYDAFAVWMHMNRQVSPRGR